MRSPALAVPSPRGPALGGGSRASTGTKKLPPRLAFPVDTLGVSRYGGTCKENDDPGGPDMTDTTTTTLISSTNSPTAETVSRLISKYGPVSITY